jgi:hypothetical protein
MIDKSPATKTGLAKVVLQCSANTFVVNQSLALRINICGNNRHLRQAPKRLQQPINKDLDFKNSTQQIH